MPSFPSFLKTSGRESHQIGRSDSGVKLENVDSAEKEQRRQSKRDYFRGLLKRSNMTPQSQRGNRLRKEQIAAPSTEVPSPTSTEKPESPMSDPNKPLPLPPSPRVAEDEPPTKPPVKLERIISPIAAPDLHRLFSGAPQFFSSSEGHYTGAPHPSVAFPWNSELEIRDLCDHIQIHDEAWGCVTAWPHITLQRSRNQEATKEHHEKQMAHFLPRCRERPNMLSMQGIERGTMGYQAALEMGVADVLQSSDEKPEAYPVAISEHRRKFLNGKDGLRPLTDPTLIDRLMTVSEIYHDDPMKHRRPTVQLYTELFTQVLHPPSRVTDSDDPYSLQVQIEALIEVLSAPTVWVDFSLVEWRIKLGRILWGSTFDPDSEDDVVINSEMMIEPNTQKYWLLLQILLSCELLIRLDALAMNIDSEIDDVKPTEISRFKKNATTSVKWSLILARCWLDNIRMEKPKQVDAAEKKSPTGWLASLTGAPGPPATVNDSLNSIRFEGRHQARQLSGLIHFAKKLNWPHIDAISAKVSSNGITISESVQNTPSGTPRSISTQRSNSYFPKRPGRGLSMPRRLSAIVHPAGWLSNSYISGFILPGEGLSHFLISTLLENDDAAMTRLGEEANLYGGFVYCDRSFWSTFCIVGRVLAAGKGASESMGWVSSDVLPRGIREGWLDIDFETVNDDLDKKSPRPRILRKQTIERYGHVIGGADGSSVLPGDFILPLDESSQEPFSVTLDSLDLFAAEDSGHTTPTNGTSTSITDISETLGIKQYFATMRFFIDADGEPRKELNLSLTNDVHFLTAHPCVPSQHTKMWKSLIGPSFRIPDPMNTTSTPGHLLHKAFTFTKVPLLQLLATPSSSPFVSLLSPPPSSHQTQSSTHTTSSSIPKVLVIDCTDTTVGTFPQRPFTSPSSPGLAENGTDTPRTIEHRHEFGSDLEMLGRALCAERGWNALVSRRGRGCLACAIREAGAVGWRVILRIT